VTDDDDKKPRKERVLHTRVPAVLEHELKRLATSLKVPVSNVVRTILEDAVDAVDSVGRVAEGELRDVADRLRERRDKLRGHKPDGGDEVDEEPVPAPVAPLGGVVGYQPLLLARDEGCTLCGRTVPAGEQAYLGIRETAGGPRVILGKECLPFSANPTNGAEDE
jgi:hypothetical protein